MKHNVENFIEAAHAAGLDMNDEELRLRYYLMYLFEQQYNVHTDGPMPEYMARRLDAYDSIGC